MTREEEMKAVVNELENIFTIDGRGRPKKAELLLNLISNYGMDIIIPLVRTISERKHF